MPRLIGRPAAEALFGSGESSESRLFAQGYFFGTGFNVVDNQLLSSLATQGILGAGLVVALFVVAAVRGGRDVRAGLIVFASALMTFDFFKLTTMVLLLTVVVCLSDRGWRRGEDDQRESSTVDGAVATTGPARTAGAASAVSAGVSGAQAPRPRVGAAASGPAASGSDLRDPGHGRRAATRP